MFERDAQTAGPTSQLAQQAESQARAEVAAMNFQAAVPLLEAPARRDRHVRGRSPLARLRRSARPRRRDVVLPPGQCRAERRASRRPERDARARPLPVGPPRPSGHVPGTDPWTWPRCTCPTAGALGMPPGEAGIGQRSRLDARGVRPRDTQRFVRTGHGRGSVPQTWLNRPRPGVCPPDMARRDAGQRRTYGQRSAPGRCARSAGGASFALHAQAAEDDEGVLGRDLPRHLAAGLDVHRRTRRCLGLEATCKRARLVLVGRAD